MKKQDRDKSLDLIKLLATMMVVKLHIGGTGILYELIHYICGCAVPLFFMTTGALILNSNKSGEIKYIFKKIINVVRILLMWGVILAVLNFIQTENMARVYSAFYESIYQGGLMGQLWYMWSLLILYLLTPQLRRLFIKNTFLTTVVIVAINFIVFCCNVLFINNNNQIFEKYIPQVLRIWSHVAYYWFGGVIYRYLSDKDNKVVLDKFNCKYSKFMVIYYFLLLTSSITQFIILNSFYGVHSPEYLFSCPIVICWNMITFFVLYQYRLSEKCGDFLYILLPTSFGVYCSHTFVINLLYRFHFTVEGHWLVQYLIVAVVSVVVSFIVLKIPVVRKLIVF